MGPKFMGCGAIALGFVALSPAVIEISSGSFSPVGYSGRSSWLTSALTLFFGQYAPYASALLWIGTAAVFFWLGVKEFNRQDSPASEEEQLPSAKLGNPSISLTSRKRKKRS